MHAIILASFVLVIQRTSSQDACADVLSTDDSLSAEFDQGTVLLQMQMQYSSATQQASDNAKPPAASQLSVTETHGDQVDEVGIVNSTTLIAEMTAIREKNDIILFTKKICHPYPKREPVFFRLGESQFDVKDSSHSQVPIVNLAISFVVFVMIFILVSVAVTIYCDRKPLLIQEQEEHAAERGRKCWIYCAFILLFVFSALVFWITLRTLIATNQKIENHPTQTQTVDGQTVSATSYVISNVGLRCIEATMGCVLSCALAAMTIAAWRKWGNVAIKAELLIVFFVRGMTLSIVFTTLTEFPGLFLMQEGEAASGSYHYYLYNLLNMGIVGFTEEGSKLAALIFCTYLSVRTLENAPSGCWPRPCLCRLLCESPRAFILAGLAVGYGFMTTENGEYMTAIVSTPVTTYETPDTSAADAASALQTENLMANIMIVAQIALRIFLNIHPWLVGISASRILSICWTNEPDLSLLGFSGFMWAVCPSAVAHGIYDFLVSVGFTVVQLLTPIVIFTFSRRIVYDKWCEAPPEPKGLIIEIDETKDANIGDPIKATEAS